MTKIRTGEGEEQLSEKELAMSIVSSFLFTDNLCKRTKETSEWKSTSSWLLY